MIARFRHFTDYDMSIQEEISLSSHELCLPKRKCNLIGTSSVVHSTELTALVSIEQGRKPLLYANSKCLSFYPPFEDTNILKPPYLSTCTHKNSDFHNDDIKSKERARRGKTVNL